MSSDHKLEDESMNEPLLENKKKHETQQNQSISTAKEITITTSLHDSDRQSVKTTLNTAEESSEQSTYATMEERTTEVFYQTLIPFLLAGLGSLSTGLLMNRVQKAPLVCDVPQFIAICTPLQAMKGNLDMTFTSRLGTMAHQGRLRKHPGRLKRILRNIAVMQAQVTFISLFATLISFFFHIASPNDTKNEWPVKNFLFLGSNSLFSMCIASAISSNGMFIVVMVAYKFSINPDNIAAPLASSGGDLLTIVTMLTIGIVYYPFSTSSTAVPVTVMVVFLMMVSLWLYVAHQDEDAWLAARQQGATLLLASILSSGAGFVQSRGAMNFPELTVYQPLITGNTGNRASVHSSRIGSYLHTYRGSNRLQIRFNPLTYYTSSDHESKVARFLLISAVPYQALFVMISYAIAKTAMTPLNLNLIFFVGYLFTASVQVFFLVYLSQVLVYGLFHYGIDPDMHAIPLLTSVGDLVGTTLLLALFYIMSYGEGLVTRSQASSNKLTNVTTVCLYE